MAWVAIVLSDFPKALCLVDALHGWEMTADDALCFLHHRLEGLVISSRAAAEPGSNAAREDALDGAPVKVSEGFCRNVKLAKLLEKGAFGLFLQPSPLALTR